MTDASSSTDLHPKHGARFVLERIDGPDPGYRVQIYLPTERLETRLTWHEDGTARLDPPVHDAWAQEETLKLARVVKRDPKPAMTRWRGRE